MMPVDVAYIAGLFDGEGSVSVTMAKASNGKRYVKLRARIAQNTRPVLAWVCLTTGLGSVTRDKKLYGRERKRMVRFQASDRQAERFLSLIRPYLHVKGAAVDAALKRVSKARGRICVSYESTWALS